MNNYVLTNYSFLIPFNTTLQKDEFLREFKKVFDVNTPRHKEIYNYLLSINFSMSHTSNNGYSLRVTK